MGISTNGQNQPAYTPTSRKPPVAVLIAPEMGGPATAARAKTEKYKPVLRPTSLTSPKAIIGAEMRETNAPDEKLSKY